MTEEELNTIMTEGMSVVDKHSLLLIVFAAGSKTAEQYQFATGSLVRVPQGIILITSGHVLDAFVSMGIDGRLQLGVNQFVLKPSKSRVITIFKKPDLAILELSESEAAALGEAILLPDQIVGREAHKFELIGLCGYPGATKTLIGENKMTHSKYRLVGTVDTVDQDQFSIRTDESRYEILNQNKGESHYPLGGIRGV